MRSFSAVAIALLAALTSAAPHPSLIEVEKRQDAGKLVFAHFMVSVRVFEYRWRACTVLRELSHVLKIGIRHFPQDCTSNNVSTNDF